MIDIKLKLSFLAQRRLQKEEKTNKITKKKIALLRGKYPQHKKGSKREKQKTKNKIDQKKGENEIVGEKVHNNNSYWYILSWKPISLV